MTCGYCGTRNEDGEVRCRRCGRKSDDTLTGTLPGATDGALATAVRMAPSAAPPEAGKVATPGPNQGSLFLEKPASKIIRFETYAPHLRTPEPPRRHRAADQQAPPRKARPTAEHQAKLDLLPAQPIKPRTSGSTGEALIYTEAPVATLLHRAVATAIDWAMVVIGYGLFLAVFRAFHGQFVLNRSNALIFGGLLPLAGLTYGLIWVIAGSETAGMRWMRLRLTTFDGFRPAVRDRLFRFLGSCLSVSTVLGMLWPLADEESLGWQDHISHTFPTPCILDDQVFRRG